MSSAIDVRYINTKGNTALELLCLIYGHLVEPIKQNNLIICVHSKWLFFNTVDAHSKLMPILS